MSTIEDEARAEAIGRYSSRVIEDYDGDRYDEDEYGYDATARSAFVKGALWAASRREPSGATTRKAIADAVRHHCTLTPNPMSGPYPLDATVQAVADWIENPPEWVRFPSESTAVGASDGTSKSNANDLDREPSANVSNHPETDISPDEMSVSEPSDTDERWEYGYYDSDDANDPARVFHQYVQGWSFPTAEAAKHTGDKNVFGKAIIVRRHPASDWEVCDEH